MLLLSYKNINHLILDFRGLFLFCAGCGESQKFQTRIVGGRPAKADEWPWLAALVSTLGSWKENEVAGFVVFSQ